MSSPIKRVLKVFVWLVGFLVVILGCLWGYVQLRWDAPVSRPVTELTAPSDSASIEWGKEIFTYRSHCWTCHQAQFSAEYTTPSGGMLFDLTEIGPGFGKWYSRNLTPDMETGLGGWTDGEIVRALREGLRKDGTPLFPVMPIDWYHGMADDDALAVVAYLRTLPPVEHKVPERQPSFPAKALFTFGVMGPKPAVTKPIVAPPRGVTAEYGKYLSNNLADCADCHTPRDLQDGHFFVDQMFAGSSFPFGGGDEGPILAHARNISPDVETGIGSWSEEDFLAAVTTGMRPDSTVLAPIMPYSLDPRARVRTAPDRRPGRGARRADLPVPLPDLPRGQGPRGASDERPSRRRAPVSRRHRPHRVHSKRPAEPAHAGFREDAERKRADRPHRVPQDHRNPGSGGRGSGEQLKGGS